MRDRLDEHRKREFLAEVEELLEQMARHLQEADRERGAGRVPAERVNALFRCVHTLKGLFALFGRKRLAELAHAAEDHMDRLRMGAALLDEAGLDTLFEVHEFLEGEVSGETQGNAAFERLLDALAAGARSQGDARDDPAPQTEGGEIPGIDPRVRRSLTRYEEHRLRQNLQQGQGIFCVHTAIDIDSLDDTLRSLVGRLGEVAEVISTMPAYSDAETQGTMAFAILVATSGSVEEIARAAGEKAEIEEQVARRIPVAPDPAPPLPEAGSSLRIDLERLDNIMNSVGDLFLVRRDILNAAGALEAHEATRKTARDLLRTTQQLEKKLKVLQRSVMDARMVPVEQVVGRLERLVRKLARRSGKEILITASGQGTELDKKMIDAIVGPLMHLVRNAVDHGIETPEERTREGKAACGTLHLAAVQRGNAVVLRFSDDGRGIQVDRVHAEAVRRELLPPGTRPEDEECLQLIFHPGFSTMDQVDEVSGRGVGLDVVHREIATLNGSIRVESEPGAGTVFELEIPVTLAIIQCLLVSVGGSTFAIPLSSVAETHRLGRARVETVGGDPVLRLRGQVLSYLDLRRHLRLDASSPAAHGVVVRSGDRSLALGVDLLMGQQEVVIKPVGSPLDRLPGIAGAAELSESRTALVLDVPSFTARSVTLSGAA